MVIDQPKPEEDAGRECMNDLPGRNPIIITNFLYFGQAQ
jgi:hypothetical protein